MIIFIRYSCVWFVVLIYLIHCSATVGGSSLLGGGLGGQIFTRGQKDKLVGKTTSSRKLWGAELIREVDLEGRCRPRLPSSTWMLCNVMKLPITGCRVHFRIGRDNFVDEFSGCRAMEVKCLVDS